MRSAGQKSLRHASALLLIALLLVPVVASGHHHAERPAAPCATCALTHHTPVVVTAIAAVALDSPLVVRVESVAHTMPTASALRLRTVRGPPALLGSEPA
jgi:hypothetical protein